MSTPCHRNRKRESDTPKPAACETAATTTKGPSKPLRCPFPYFGGKFPVVEVVNRKFGEIVSLREPFAGSAALTLARQPVKHEAINDVNHYIVNFWRAVKADPEAVAEHALHPVNEADLHARSFYLFRGEETKGVNHRIANEAEFYDAKRAGWFAWGKNCQIANDFEMCVRAKPNLRDCGFCTPIYRTQRARQLATLDWLIALSERLHNVRVLHGDWSRLVSSNTALGLYGKGKSISGIFLDPPYAHNLDRVHQLLGITPQAKEVNKGRTDCYLCDDDKDQVDRLVADVNLWCQSSGSNPRLRIALCGYSGEHDNLIELGWQKHSWTAQGGWANTGKKTTRGKANKKRETIWFSPHCDDA